MRPTLFSTMLTVYSGDDLEADTRKLHVLGEFHMSAKHILYLIAARKSMALLIKTQVFAIQMKSLMVAQRPMNETLTSSSPAMIPVNHQTLLRLL